MPFAVIETDCHTYLPRRSIDILPGNVPVLLHFPQFKVRFCRLTEHGNMTMRSKRLKLLEQKAGEGNARARYELGLMYYRGDGVDKNMAKARRWLSRWSAHRQCVNTMGKTKLRIW